MGGGYGSLGWGGGSNMVGWCVPNLGYVHDYSAVVAAVSGGGCDGSVHGLERGCGREA